jgi:glucose/arabinose dehydrogenase
MRFVYCLLPVIAIFVIGYVDYPSINAEPVVFDKSLTVEKIAGELSYPVSMSFLGPNDIIVLEKDSGIVKRVVNGQIMDDPLLKINVDHRIESGLLGSAVGLNSSGNTLVFLYFTENNISLLNGTATNITENKLYRYDFEDGKLLNPKLLYEAPIQEYNIHNGGKIVIGLDNNLYLLIGDLLTSKHLLTSNYPEGSIDGSGGIISLTFDGLPVHRILGDHAPLSFYYAYGIRNGFGLDFDPITGGLWDTENGPNYGDEINLIDPGFNSGWKKVQGIWEPDPKLGENKGQLFINHSKLVTFNGSGQYSPPEYIWDQTIGVTAIKFFNSTDLGKDYANDMFVGDYKNGNLYHFDLNHNRTKIIDRHATITNNDNFSGREDILIHNEKNLPACMKEFACTVDFINKTDAVPNKILITTTSQTSGNGSKIVGKEYGVIPENEYNLTVSMKLNQYASNSIIKIEGYNNESKWWEPLGNCTNNLTGPFNWTRFDCTFDIPSDISKVRPIINAGYSNGTALEAVSHFTNIGIIDGIKFIDLFPDINYSDYTLLGKFGHITDIQVSPNGGLYVLALLGNDDIQRQGANLTVMNPGVIYKVTKQ